MSNGVRLPWEMPPPKGWEIPDGVRALSHVLNMWEQAGFAVRLIIWFQPTGLALHVRTYVRGIGEPEDDSIGRLPGTPEKPPQESVLQFVGGFTVTWGGYIRLLDDYHRTDGPRRN